LNNTQAQIWIGDVVRADNPAVATFRGVGDVAIGVNEAAFGVIDRDDLNGSLTMFVAMDNVDDNDGFEQFQDFDYMLVEGFDAVGDKVFFGSGSVVVSQDNNGDIVDHLGIGSLGMMPANWAVLEDFTSEAGLIDALDLALDGTFNVAYAKFTGTATLNGQTVDGSTSDLYAVAYDADAYGITSLLLVKGAFNDSNLIQEMF